VLICHGSVEERYGLDTTIRAVALLKEELPELRFDVYGAGAYLPSLKALARDLGVEQQVFFSGRFVPIDDLVQAIAAADVGVVAMKRDAFRDLTHCNKMYDFVTMRVPAIISRTRSVEAYFPDACFEYFESDDAADLARAIRVLHDDPERRRRLVEEAARVNEPYRWPRQREHYQRIVCSLLDRGRAAVHASETRERVGT
jgi:glycosyltransferase involved in cell wall biosynthesis